MRRHVAGRPGVAVVAPSSAYAIGLLVDGEVVSGALELDAHGDSARAGADDRDRGLVSRGGHPARLRQGPMPNPEARSNFAGSGRDQGGPMPITTIPDILRPPGRAYRAASAIATVRHFVGY